MSLSRLLCEDERGARVTTTRQEEALRQVEAALLRVRWGEVRIVMKDGNAVRIQETHEVLLDG